jgi:hypothetical protein
MLSRGIVLSAACGFGIAALAALGVAEDRREASAPAQPREVETLKERLSDKASDEQRVDNCNVPPEKRGKKQRPDACPTQASATARK